MNKFEISLQKFKGTIFKITVNQSEKVNELYKTIGIINSKESKKRS